MSLNLEIDETLIEEIDRITGAEGRNQFVEAAIREKLSRAALGAALKASAGRLIWPSIRSGAARRKSAPGSENHVRRTIADWKGSYQG